MRVKNYSISSLQLRGDTFLMIQFCGITTLRISCTRPDVELINNERRAKKPESGPDASGARRVRLMRWLGCYFLKFRREKIMGSFQNHQHCQKKIDNKKVNNKTQYNLVIAVIPD